MRILGISGLYHDSAAALTIDGEIIAAAQEERFTRVKGDARFPIEAIRYCLREANLTSAQLDAVVYYDNPRLSYARFIKNILSLGDSAKDLIELSFDSMFKQKLWIHKIVDNYLGLPGLNQKLLVANHHISHAASAFYPSPFKEAAILTLDGVGEFATTAIGFGEGENLSLIRQIEYPHSLGLMYSAITLFCGFKVNSGEYKLMGLAPYGEPKYADIIREKLIDIKNDGSFKLNMEYFGYFNGNKMTAEALDKLFGGKAREFESPITKREMNLAASIQNVTEEIMLKLAKTAQKITGSKYLCIAGGVGLNCVANGKLLSAGIFDDIWIQPAAGDAGGALGAALYTEYVHFGGKRKINKNDSQKGSYLGPAYSDVEITGFLNGIGADYKRFDSSKELNKKVAKLLADGNIVGLFAGRMEFGPRALGNRSILADARNPETQVKLNMKIKYRESFRPFAPIVLEEYASEYFELKKASPYMLLVANVKAARCRAYDKKFYITDAAAESDVIDLLPLVRQSRSDIPAVTHVDYSARVQTISKEANSFVYDLMTEFYELTGCPVLTNTSFNVRGEPIVCTPDNAYKCFMNTEMDALIMGDVLLLKSEQPYYNWIQKGGNSDGD